MNKSLSFFSFLSRQSTSTVLWCYTGAGHFFKSNLNQLLKLNQTKVPICLIFSNAGALIANRYGFRYLWGRFSTGGGSQVDCGKAGEQESRHR